MDADVATALLILLWTVFGITGMCQALKWQYTCGRWSIFGWVAGGPLSLAGVTLHHWHTHREH